MSILRTTDLCYDTIQQSGNHHNPLQTMQHDSERGPEYTKKYISGQHANISQTVQPLPGFSCPTC